MLFRSVKIDALEETLVGAMSERMGVQGHVALTGVGDGRGTQGLGGRKVWQKVIQALS